MFLYLQTVKEFYINREHYFFESIINCIKLFYKIGRFKIHYNKNKLNYDIMKDYHNWVKEYLKWKYVGNHRYNYLSLKTPFECKVNIDYYTGYDLHIKCVKMDISKVEYIFDINLLHKTKEIFIKTQVNTDVDGVAIGAVYGKNITLDQQIDNILKPLLLQIFLQTYKELV